MLDFLNNIAGLIGWILVGLLVAMLLIYTAKELYIRYYWRHYFSKPWWKREESIFNRNIFLKW